MSRFLSLWAIAWLRKALNALAQDAGNDNTQSFNTALQCFMVQDVCRCFRLLGFEDSIDYDSKQGQLLYVMMTFMLKDEEASYSSYKQEMLFDDEITAQMRELYQLARLVASTCEPEPLSTKQEATLRTMRQQALNATGDKAASSEPQH